MKLTDVRLNSDNEPSSDTEKSNTDKTVNKNQSMENCKRRQDIDFEAASEAYSAMMACRITTSSIRTTYNKLCNITEFPPVVSKKELMVDISRDYRVCKVSREVNVYKLPGFDNPDELRSGFAQRTVYDGPYVRDYKQNAMQDLIKKLHPKLWTFDMCRVIDLSGQLIGDSGVNDLCKNLSGSPVETLALNKNNISDEGLMALSLHLRSLSHLQCLHLARNAFRDEGIEALFHGDRYSPSLRLLNISENNVGARSAWAIGMMMYPSRQSHLSELIFGGQCHLHYSSDNFIRALIPHLILHGNRCLKKLNVSHSGLTDSGILGIITLLMARQSGGEDRFELSKSHFRREKGIEYLVLSRAPIFWSKYRFAFLNALMANKSLNTLVIKECGFRSHEMSEIENYTRERHVIRSNEPPSAFTNAVQQKSFFKDLGASKYTDSAPRDVRLCLPNSAYFSDTNQWEEMVWADQLQCTRLFVDQRTRLEKFRESEQRFISEVRFAPPPVMRQTMPTRSKMSMFGSGITNVKKYSDKVEDTRKDDQSKLAYLANGEQINLKYRLPEHISSIFIKEIKENEIKKAEELKLKQELEQEFLEETKDMSDNAVIRIRKQREREALLASYVAMNSLELAVSKNADELPAGVRASVVRVLDNKIAIEDQFDQLNLLSDAAACVLVKDIQAYSEMAAMDDHIYSKEDTNNSTSKGNTDSKASNNRCCEVLKDKPTNEDAAGIANNTDKNECDFNVCQGQAATSNNDIATALISSILLEAMKHVSHSMIAKKESSFKAKARCNDGKVVGASMKPWSQVSESSDVNPFEAYQYMYSDDLYDNETENDNLLETQQSAAPPHYSDAVATLELLSKDARLNSILHSSGKCYTLPRDFRHLSSGGSKCTIFEYSLLTYRCIQEKELKIKSSLQALYLTFDNWNQQLVLRETAKNNPDDVEENSSKSRGGSSRMSIAERHSWLAQVKLDKEKQKLVEEERKRQFFLETEMLVEEVLAQQLELSLLLEQCIGCMVCIEVAFEDSCTGVDRQQLLACNDWLSNARSLSVSIDQLEVAASYAAYCSHRSDLKERVENGESMTRLESSVSSQKHVKLKKEFNPRKGRRFKITPPMRPAQEEDDDDQRCNDRVVEQQEHDSGDGKDTSKKVRSDGETVSCANNSNEENSAGGVSDMFMRSQYSGPGECLDGSESVHYMTGWDDEDDEDLVRESPPPDEPTTLPASRSEEGERTKKKRRTKRRGRGSSGEASPVDRRAAARERKKQRSAARAATRQSSGHNQQLPADCDNELPDDTKSRWRQDNLTEEASHCSDTEVDGNGEDSQGYHSDHTTGELQESEDYAPQLEATEKPVVETETLAQRRVRRRAEAKAAKLEAEAKAAVHLPPIKPPRKDPEERKPLTKAQRRRMRRLGLSPDNEDDVAEYKRKLQEAMWTDGEDLDKWATPAVPLKPSAASIEKKSSFLGLNLRGPPGANPRKNAEQPSAPDLEVVDPLKVMEVMVPRCDDGQLRIILRYLDGAEISSGYYVIGFKPKSSAEGTLQPRDKVVEIEGIKVGGCTLKEIGDIISNTPSRMIRFGIRRKATTRPIFAQFDGKDGSAGRDNVVTIEMLEQIRAQVERTQHAKKKLKRNIKVWMQNFESEHHRHPTEDDKVNCDLFEKEAKLKLQLEHDRELLEVMKKDFRVDPKPYDPNPFISKQY